jgi:hypothetical protein
MQPLGDEAAQAVACVTKSCCADFVMATASCPDALAPGDVSCEESTVSEEDLDFAWTLLPSSDLRELSVDLPEHQFSFADVAMPCSFVARESRARRVFPADTSEKVLMSMPPEDINPPTSPPTPSPTVAPTAHPCEDGSHGCDAAKNEMCVQEGAGFRCDCAPGFGRCACSAVLYQNDDQSGWSASFGIGSYGHSQLVAAGAKNDDATSIVVESGCAATLYQHGDFTGWNETLIAGTHQIVHNDDASSIVVACAGQCVRTPPPTPAPTATVYEGCQIQGGGGSYYANYGRGKCVYVDGRDFGKVWDAGFKYVHKGGRRCESDCTADSKCCGYAVSRHSNCLMWYGAIRKKPGHDWGAANCMVKR